MLTVDENLYFDPERLLLISGKVVDTEGLEVEIRNKFEDIFREDLSSADCLFQNKSFQEVDYNMMFPVSGGICLSDACQLRCNYCAFASDNSNDKKVVSYSDAEIFIDYLVGNCIIRRFHNRKKDYVLDLYFAGGGEPTFDWNLLYQVTEMVKEKCRKHNLAYTLGITTNGILNELQIKYIADNFDVIAVSFDGLPEIQNQNRKLLGEGDTFAYVDRTIRKMGEFGKKIILRSTVWPRDYNRLLDMIRFVYGNYKNIDTWGIEPINARGRAVEQATGTINQSFVDYYIEVQNYIIEQGYDNILVCGKFKDNLSGYSCGTVFGLHPWLLTDGRIVTCLDAKEKAAVVAEIKNGVLTKYKFRDNLAYCYMQARNNCKSCFAYKFCGAGCPIKYTNEIEIDSMKCECEMTREYWRYIFKELINHKSVFDWTAKCYKLDNHPELSLFQIWRKTWELK